LRMLAFRPAEQTAATAGSGSKAAAKPAAKPAARAAAVSPVPKANATRAPAARAWADPDWASLMNEIGLAGSLRMLAGNCALDKREGNTVYFSLDPRSESMLTRQRKDALAAALSKYFGENLAVDIRIAEAPPETPHEQENRIADERIVAARESLESDPNVQALKNMFGAELKADTIEPLDTSRSD